MEYAVADLTTGSGYMWIWMIIYSAIILPFPLAVIPGKIAKRKGYRFAAFYWFGVGALIPAIIVSSCIKKRDVDSKPERVNRINAAGYSSADEIAKYKALLDQGAITQPEFEMKKRQLLGL